MLRLTALITLLATPVVAQDKETLCAVSGDIVGAAVAERVGGADAETARDHVIDALPDEQANFKPAVGHLVEWVYTLPPEQLTDEVAPSFIEQCLAN